MQRWALSENMDWRQIRLILALTGADVPDVPSDDEDIKKLNPPNFFKENLQDYWPMPSMTPIGHKII